MNSIVIAHRPFRHFNRSLINRIYAQRYVYHGVTAVYGVVQKVVVIVAYMCRRDSINSRLAPNKRFVLTYLRRFIFVVVRIYMQM